MIVYINQIIRNENNNEAKAMLNWQIKKISYKLVKLFTLFISLIKVFF